MQLVGGRFTAATAAFGNDLSTLPDFPAEIRAPAGTPNGVSAFQIHFASRDILTPGDHPNTLVAMNPAALKANLKALEAGGTVIVNEDAFTDNNLRKAGYEENPLDDGTLESYQLFRVPMTSMTTRATEEIEGLKPAEAQRTKNIFALGLVSWLYGRPTEASLSWLETKFAKKPAIKDANVAAFKAGYNFGETTEIAAIQIDVEPAPLDAGEYRNVDGDPGAGAGPDRGRRQERPAAVLRHLPDHAGLRAPPPPRPPRPLRRPHGAGRGRDRRRQHGGRRRLRRPPRDHRDQRPRDGPQGGDDRPRGDARAADGDHRRAARRPLDRDADQDRADRPADGDPRPPRRVAAAGDRAGDAGRLLRVRRSRRCGSRSATGRR